MDSAIKDFNAYAWEQELYFPTLPFKKEDAVELEDMRQLDFQAVERYHLPVDLMMENAGLWLARIVSLYARPYSQIQIGVGTGNNGGGGLVAARRLCAWGYRVYLHLPDKRLKELAKVQLERALAFGARQSSLIDADIFVDAYFGFSQRLPLPEIFLETVKQVNRKKALRISLDLPTAIAEDDEREFLDAHVLCTLAAPKRILFDRRVSARLFVVDLGIPASAYKECNLKYAVPFQESPVFELTR